MKINQLLRRSTQQLEAAGIPTARLDCLVMFEDVLNTNRIQILAHPEKELTEVEWKHIADMVAKRANHTPLAYVRGKTEFYGREFKITPDVLEPRPESETMIDLLKKLPINPQAIVADIGTGSGSLAITAALELKTIRVIATDISAACLQVARINAQTHSTNIELYQGDLLDALPAPHSNQPRILLCNLPYVPDDFKINTAASHEPRLAIFGGSDGLALFRKLFHQLINDSSPVAYVLCESLPLQHKALAQIAQNAGYQEVNEQDFIQVFRAKPS